MQSCMQGSCTTLEKAARIVTAAAAAAAAALLDLSQLTEAKALKPFVKVTSRLSQVRASLLALESNWRRCCVRQFAVSARQF